MKVEGSFPGLARYFTKELQIKHWYLTPIALVIFSKGRVAVDSESLPWSVHLFPSQCNHSLGQACSLLEGNKLQLNTLSNCVHLLLLKGQSIIQHMQIDCHCPCRSTQSVLLLIDVSLCIWCDFFLFFSYLEKPTNGQVCPALKSSSPQ